MIKGLPTLQDLGINLPQMGVNTESTILEDVETIDEMRDLLEEARQDYDSWVDFRDRRERSREYYRGRQWSDTIADPDERTVPGQTAENKKITEKTLIERDGKVAMVNNQIRQLMKNLLGQFIDNDYDPVVRSQKREIQSSTEMMTETLRHIYELDDITEKDARSWEEFLMSGMAVSKEGFQWNSRLNRTEVYSHRINPNRMIVDSTAEMFNGEDIKLIGEIHDLDFEDILFKFAGDNPANRERLEDIFNPHDGQKATYTTRLGANRIDNVNFFVSEDSDKFRIFEIWRLENQTKVIVHDTADGITRTFSNETVEDTLQRIQSENAERIAQYLAAGYPAEVIPLKEVEVREDQVWAYYFLAPTGELLDWGETPYEHGLHPYSIALYPMIDGEVWGFIEDIIDQQRHINRLITLIDFVIGSSAKGLLRIPEGSIPDGWSEEDFAEAWVKTNGFIVYVPLPGGEKPDQVNAAATPAAAADLLQIELGLMKEISGITEAIQGQTPSAGTPASLYQQQTTNSTLASRDYFEFFFNWRKKRDLRLVQIAQQYYTEKRYINISGKNYSQEAIEYDPALAANAEYNIKVTKSAKSPIFRDLIDNHLMQFLQMGAIDLEMFLDNTQLPFSDKIKEQIKAKRTQLEEQGINPDTSGISGLGVQVNPLSPGSAVTE